MQEQLIEKPALPEGILFTLKDITYSPVPTRMKEPFTVKGKVELFKIPFVAPVWVIVTVEYPEALWEEIIPIVGAPQVREMAMAIGGDFKVTFKEGFEREGEFKLTSRLYAGPTVPIDKLTLPPFPPVYTDETTFIVAGKVPPEEIIGFRNIEIVSYSKNGGTPVTAGEVLELQVGDRCRVNIGYEHKGDAITKVLYSAIGNIKPWPIGFDEVVKGQKTTSVPKSEEWQPFQDSVDIPITTAISPGDYDLYAKIDTVISPYVENVIRIVGVPTKPNFRNLEIVDYTTPVAVGGTCSVKVRFEYMGPATTKRVYVATWVPQPWDPHDEVDIAQKSVSLRASPEWMPIEEQLDIRIPSTRAPGFYGLYFKIDGLLSDFYPEVVQYTAVPKAAFANLQVISYDAKLAVGGTCHVKVRFDYQGPKISKTLRSVIGNIKPWPIGFDEIIYGSKSISVPETLSWKSYEATVDIVITTAISPGVYDLYAKIDTLLSPFYENVITIEKAVAPPPGKYTLAVRVSPMAAGWVVKDPDKASYSYGEVVILTARAAPGYRFSSWRVDTEFAGTTNPLRYMVVGNYVVTAYFGVI